MKVIVIGRSKESDIIIADQAISEHHLQIVEEGGKFSAIDLDSTNGTFVNGVRITGTVELKEGDTVKIGNSELAWSSYFSSGRKSKISSKRWMIYSGAGVLATIIVVILCLTVFGGDKKDANSSDTAIVQESELNTLSEERNNNKDIERQIRLAEEVLNSRAQTVEQRNAKEQAQKTRDSLLKVKAISDGRIVQLKQDSIKAAENNKKLQAENARQSETIDNQTKTITEQREKLACSDMVDEIRKLCDEVDVNPEILEKYTKFNDTKNIKHRAEELKGNRDIAGLQELSKKLRESIQEQKRINAQPSTKSDSLRQ